MEGWPTTIEELISEQKRIAMLSVSNWEKPSKPFVCAAVFICYGRQRSGPGKKFDQGWGAAIALFPDGQLKTFTISERASFDYIPGLLALRDGPLLEKAVVGLNLRPELLFVNATSRDHPHRAGLALHLGYKLDIPTVGITRKPLIATGVLPGKNRGDRSELRIGNETVAFWLRTQENKAPLVVHPGYRLDWETAIEIVLSYTIKYRTPEPLRLARKAARLCRAGLVRSALCS
ncbi:endonuclease V [Methylacidiphilum sp. Yel]|jgi:deoxyribonuclease V|uniref:endonuclease V n=1 Tax=Methylacidiphilum sp. Yel TaxID=1847730 RepID=UPI00106A6AAC|nr:endonuclease V [Methylacidiphilum sp. Yel]TFE68368.1 endonuclease V [Methylacidiphilum sp. Yel]